MYETKDNYLGHREGDIFCRLVTNELTVQNIKFKYHIELVAPEIEIKPKNILFPSLAQGERKFFRVLITNKSNQNYLCEWLTPPSSISGLIIMPKVFELKIGKFTTCVIQYTSDFRSYGPFTIEEIEKEIGMWIAIEEELKIIDNNLEVNQTNPLLDDKLKKEIDSVINNAESYQNDKKKKGNTSNATNVSNASQPKKLDPKKDKKQIEEEEKKKKEDEEKIAKEIDDKKHTRIHNFDRDKELKLFGAEIINFEDQDGKSTHSKFTIPLYYKSLAAGKSSNNINKTFIQISTTCVEKLLVFEKSEINFGEVSVKTRKIINITLHNNSNRSLNIKMKPLIVSNCFQIINSVREIPPLSSFNFIVEFFPLQDLPYLNEFTVYTGSNNIEETQSTVVLIGKGVQPEISINLKDGILYMGNTCTNNSLEKTFEIRNDSTFNVNYEIKTINKGKINKNGYKPFCFIPYKGELLANSKQTVRVTFLGDHQDFMNFFEMILIDVANQKHPNFIFVTACCWSRQTYWREFYTPTFPQPNFFSKTVEQDYFIEALRLKPTTHGVNNEKIILQFVKFSEGLSKDELEKTTKRKIIIGCCKMNDPKNEKNGNYEIIIPKDELHFTCDMAKGSIISGSETIITFNFKKPNKDSLLKEIEVLNDVGMWITSTVELKISGGFIYPGYSDLVSVEILLSAYIEQI